MTNYLKTAYDDLIVIIKAQYPRFIDPGRIAVEMLIGGEVQLEKSMLGYEDCIIIVPSDTKTEETSMILTSGGSLATYNMRLLYYKPKILENEFDSVTDFAESLCNYLKEKGHTIIIYTARRMRTHHGNIGEIMAELGKITLDTLEKFNIKYDEFYFGI